MTKKINLDEVRQLSWATDYIFGYETDNSCGDPDCCGGPFFNKKDYEEALEDLLKFGLEYDPTKDD